MASFGSQLNQSNGPCTGRATIAQLGFKKYAQKVKEENAKSQLKFLGRFRGNPYRSGALQWKRGGHLGGCPRTRCVRIGTAPIIYYVAEWLSSRVLV